MTVAEISTAPEPQLSDAWSPEVLASAYEALYHPQPPPPAVRATVLDEAYFAWLNYVRYTVELPWLRGEANFTGFLDAKVLEIGTGTGQDLCSFARHGAKVFGLELDLALARITNEQLTRLGHPQRVVSGDGRRLPFADDVFDHIFVCDLEGAIGSLVALHPFSRELIRVLRPGGEITIARSHRRVFTLDHPRGSPRSDDPSILPIAGSLPILATDRHRLSDVNDPHPGLATIAGFYGLWRLVSQGLPAALMARVPDPAAPAVRCVGRPVRRLVEAPFRLVHDLGERIRRRDLTAPIRAGIHRLLEADRRRRDGEDPLPERLLRAFRSTNPRIAEPIRTRSAIGADPQIAPTVPPLGRVRFIAQRSRPVLRFLGLVVSVALLAIVCVLGLLTWPLRRLVHSTTNRVRTRRLGGQIRKNVGADLYYLQIHRDRTVIKLRGHSAPSPTSYGEQR